MTNAEKITMVKALSDETSDEVVSAFLSMAGDAVVNFADSSHTVDPDDILDKYSGVQCRLAALWLNKRGWEGQVSHSENGISRTYEVGDIPPSFLREITPYCAAVK